MRIFSRKNGVFAALLLAVGAQPVLAHGASEQGATNARIQQAYVYALPVWEVARVQYLLLYDTSRVTRRARGRTLVPNRLYDRHTLSTPKNRLITGPNGDTLYSVALLDLRGGSVTIDVPEMGTRYYSIALIDEYTNDFAYIGTRATGDHSGSYQIVGPSERTGELTDKNVIIAPTNDVILLVRIMVYGPADLATANDAQEKIRLVAPASLPPRPAPPPPFPKNGESFAEVVNYWISQDPPPARDDSILREIGKVGIGPFSGGLTPSLLSAWKRVYPAVAKAFHDWSPTDQEGTVFNGWRYPKPDRGRFGTDYRYRAVTAEWGLFATTPAEKMSIGAVQDSNGRPLAGNGRYVLRIPAHVPAAFWSLSVHQVTARGLFFANNSIDRWTINPYTPGLKRNGDGSIDIYIQRNRPPENDAANWLPLPAGRFHITLRNYLPRPSLLDGSFHYPPIMKQS